MRRGVYLVVTCPGPLYMHDVRMILHETQICTRRGESAQKLTTVRTRKGKQNYKHRNEETWDINMLGLTAIHNPRGLQYTITGTLPFPSSLDQRVFERSDLAQAKLASELWSPCEPLSDSSSLLARLMPCAGSAAQPVGRAVMADEVAMP
jgi:hypothetical protein